MKRTLKCDNKNGGCGMEYEIEEDSVKKDKHIQCPNPYCARITKNPLYEE